MKIAGREISANHPPFVIAEIGINHGGDLAVAKEMVRLAALSGCECGNFPAKRRCIDLGGHEALCAVP